MRPLLFWGVVLDLSFSHSPWASTKSLPPLDLPLDAVAPFSGGVWDGDSATQQGQAALIEGHALLAARIFSTAAALHAHEASLFNNLATALATLSMERPDVKLSCEALAAAHVAWVLGHSNARELAMGIEQELLGSQKCDNFEASEFEKLLNGVASREEHIFMVRKMCSSPERVVLTPTWREQQYGVWTAVNLRKAWILMRVCGVVAVQQVLPEQVVTQVAHAQSVRSEKSALPKLQAFKDVDAASRGGLRQEVHLPLSPPFTDPEVVAQPLMRSLVHLFVGENVELDTFSYIQSSPGSLDQAWHNDVPTPKEHNCHMAPFGVVALLPLVDIDSANGATEFLSGSHVGFGDDRFWLQQDDGEIGGASDATPHLQIPLTTGSLALFDLRLRHRGRANKAMSARPVLYMSFVQEWFQDRVNFVEKQTPDWDALPASTKKLFARLDTRKYIRLLEEELLKHGVSVQELFSQSHYKKRTEL